MNIPFIRRKNVGAPPGEINEEEILEENVQRREPPNIQIIDYTPDNVEVKESKTCETCFPYKETDTVTWINVNGLNPEAVKTLCNHYDIHPLAQEDILTRGQRPKIEDYENYVFITLRMLSYAGAEEGVQQEEISIILGENYVISFQETTGDMFDPVRERIQNGKGKIRKMKTDYLAYALIDVIVDTYFYILENLGEDLEEVEEDLIHEPEQESLQRIHKLKREMINVRRAVWPLREVINGTTTR